MNELIIILSVAFENGLKHWLPIMVTIALSLSDAIIFGWVHEIKKWLSNSLFKGYPMYGEMWYPYYRIYQWSLDLIAIYLVYVNCGFWATLLMLMAWFFMNKEMNYYLILGQWKELKRYEKEQLHVYWLDRIYFSGSFFFIDGFTVKSFIISYIVSWLFLIGSVLIQSIL